MDFSRIPVSKMIITERDLATANLVGFLSMAAYEELPDNVYKCRLDDCLQRILLSCRCSEDSTDSLSVSSIILTCYDAAAVSSCLAQIHWKELCAYYNQNARDSTRQDSLPASGKAIPRRWTPLKILLETLHNPLNWPSCCQTSVLQSILDVYVLQLHGTSCPSRQYLLEYMTYQLLAQHASLLTNLQSTRESFCLLNGVIKRLKTAGQAESLLLLLKRWFDEFPAKRVTWLTHLLSLIARIEEMEHNVLQVPRQQTEKFRARPIFTRHTWKTTGSVQSNNDFSYAHLHEELMDGQQEMTLPRQRQPLCTSMNVLMRMEDCESSMAKTHLLGFWKLRSHCFKIVLHHSRTMVHGWLTTSRDLSYLPRRFHPVTTLLQVLLDVAQHHRSSSSTIVLCVFALVHSELKKLGNFIIPTPHNNLYQLLQSIIWSRATLIMQSTNEEDRAQSLFYVRLYMELISECSYYDNVENLHQALIPLLNAFTHSSLESLRHHLPSLAYLFARRGHMLLTSRANITESNFHRHLDLFLRRLSLSFGHVSDWIHPATTTTNHREQESQLRALQCIGILGLSAELDDVSVKKAISKVEFNLSVRASAKQIEAWVPFVALFSNKYDAKNSESNSLTLFSIYSPENRVPLSQKPSQRIDSTTSARTMMHSLNDDLLQNIFTFLTHKRLVRMRLVNSQWKQNADAKYVWYLLFRAKFGIPLDDPIWIDTTATTTTITTTQSSLYSWDWWTLYRDRWHAQQEIRFRYARNQPQWKVRICQYVGCLQILSTPAQLNRHYYQKHRLKKQHTSTKCGRKAGTKRKIEQIIRT